MIQNLRVQRPDHFATLVASKLRMHLWIPVVVDANIIFSALLRRGNKFFATLKAGGRFVVSETILAEIFRHKEKIVAASHLDRDEIVDAYRFFSY